MHEDPEACAALLASGDPPPFLQLQGRSLGCFIVCDHASAAIPSALGTLGLARNALSSHIAIDLGARWAAMRIAERLDAPAVIAGYSRLVVDLNRYPWDPASMTPQSDRTPIPGNLGLAPDVRAARIEALFLPYHRAIAARLDALAERAAQPVFLSIHTCTPQLDGQSRPWQIGLSYRPPDPLAERTLKALRLDPQLTVGDNQPYTLDLGIDYTTPEHAMRRGLPYLQVEFRQDLVSSPADARRWADRLVDVLTSVTEAPRVSVAPPGWDPGWPSPHRRARAVDLQVRPCSGAIRALMPDAVSFARNRGATGLIRIPGSLVGAANKNIARIDGAGCNRNGMITSSALARSARR